MHEFEFVGGITVSKEINIGIKDMLEALENDENFKTLLEKFSKK